MKKTLLGLLGFAACLTLLSLTAAAQDFSKSYALTAGGTVRVMNVSGDIKITGTDSPTVTVQAFKTGRDKDKIDVEDLSSGNNVEVKVRYPKCDEEKGARNSCSYEADVRFEVAVPRSIALELDKINTASGDIEVTGVQANIHVATASGNVTVSDSHGTIRAATASGNVTVRNVAGQVNASSASGDVEADIARLEGNDNMSFNTASGNVNVRMPADLDADVSMSTVSGKVKTDFPLEVKESEYGGGTHAKGRIGSGMRQVRLSSASGDVSLTRM